MGRFFDGPNAMGLAPKPFGMMIAAGASPWWTASFAVAALYERGLVATWALNCEGAGIVRIVNDFSSFSRSTRR